MRTGKVRWLDDADTEKPTLYAIRRVEHWFVGAGRFFGGRLLAGDGDDACTCHCDR
jgi:hypothetical protein